MDVVKNALQTAVQRAYKVELQVEVESVTLEHGDFSTNLAFRLAGQLKLSPAVIAQTVAKAIQTEAIASVTAAGAGYINVKMTDAYWYDQLAKIDELYGSSAIGRGQKVQVEFISANPTGPLTMANARGGYIGDAIARVLVSQGYKVEREHYLNDAGGQIEKLTQSIRHESGLPIEEERQYSGPYVKALADQLQPKADTPDYELAASAIATIFTMLKSAVKRMGIEFDTWFSERSLIEDGTVELVLQRLTNLKLVYQKEGATWLRSSSFGDSRDRVLIKSNGEYIYLLNDIAYHYNIFIARGFDRAIKVWGADHAGQVASLKLAIQQLIPEAQLDFVLMQMVRVIKDGKEFKSSKRAGTYITMDELLDEVGSADVARFFFLMRSVDTQMDFDLDLAREQSQKNPLFYVMYAYARARSILAKAKERDLTPTLSRKDLSPGERELIKQLSRWPGLLSQIAADYGVQRLTFYGQELARLFHDLYESERIIDLTPTEAAARLYVVQQFVRFMDRYFDLMGITPVARMEHEVDSAH